MPMTNEELEIMQYKKVYDYTQYSHDNHINVIPEKDFKHLVQDTFKTIVDILKTTYGPYGTIVTISDQSQTISTKDGYNAFQSLGFSHQYKRRVYLAIKKIIERVNASVGDGTTSCILLAEKIFNNLNDIIKSADDKRNILRLLNVLETEVQKEKYNENGVFKLNKESLKSMINVASNYDDKLPDVIMEALKPQYDEDGNVVSINNVVLSDEVDTTIDTHSEFEVDYLPGDYRTHIDIDIEVARSMVIPRNIKILVFDHTFSDTDWNALMEVFDDTYDILLLGTAFAKHTLDTLYMRYCLTHNRQKQPVHIYIGQIKGSYVRNEVLDLGHVIHANIKTLNDPRIELDDMCEAKVSIYKGNCLCIYDIDPVSESYIQDIKDEMNADIELTLTKRQNYIDRLNALEKRCDDSMITVTSDSTLESHVICDKIDDCVSIVNSAMTNGVVPNMLKHGYDILGEIGNSNDGLMKDVCKALQKSIMGLFEEIWVSKYYELSDIGKEVIRTYYEEISSDTSYDIIDEKLRVYYNFPTSSQYDIEVISAAISIVKYLLTSSAFIFDACLLPQHGDQGRYVQS